MSFFRGDRVLSNFLRHDPFSPFSRPSLNPFYSPFFTVFDEPRGRYYDYQAPQQQTITQGSSKASPSNKAESTPQGQGSQQGSQELSRTSNGDDGQVERRHRRHRGRHSEASHPLSVFGGSPFTGSAWPSLFNSALAPFAPLTAAVQAIPDISVDVHSTPQAYSIHAAVPGMDKNDIKVTVEEGVLTIEAERREARTRQPTNRSAATNTASSTTASGASSSPSSTASSTPSAAAEVKSQEAKEESKEEKSAAPSTSSGASDGSNASTAASAMEEEAEDFHYSETFYGRVQRSIQLPEDAKVDDLTAKYEDGVLKIDIPRVQEQKTRGRRIEIQ